eukprot:5393103-Prorocentrum_lima.AAC.1
MPGLLRSRIEAVIAWDIAYPPWVTFLGRAVRLLSTLVAGQPKAYIEPNVIGCLDALANFRRNYGIN